jgi:hypothetical protein
MDTDKIVSNYLLSKLDLWIWDFDGTLIEYKAYIRNKMSRDEILNLDIKKLNMDIPFWKDFKILIKYLIKNNKRIAIASFGTYSIIKSYMDRIFGENQTIFTKYNILSPSRDSNGNLLEKYPSKNVYIKQLINFYKIQNPSRVIFFDDNMTNIAEAIKLGVISVKIGGNEHHNIDDNGVHFNLSMLKIIEKDLYNRNIISVNNDFGSIGFRKIMNRNYNNGIIIKDTYKKLDNYPIIEKFVNISDNNFNENILKFISGLGLLYVIYYIINK